MKKGVFVTITLTAFALGIFLLSGALGAAPKVNVAIAVTSQVNANGSAYVLIKMKPMQEKNFFSFSTFSMQTANITSNTSSVIKTVGNKRVQFSNENLVYARVNSSDLAAIENNPQVESVTLQRVFHLNDESPTSQVNVTSAHTTIFDGKNLTGKGETVCVIDSGVDYNLSDLGGCYGYNNVSSNCTVIGGYNYLNTSATPMDDFGHGTHVAGIIAAHGGITGVAPGAKIIAMEVCNSAGSCYEGYIQKAIQWCTTNASKFNISVISMSLGTNVTYPGYCNSDPLASTIDTAVAKNISVVVASGNDGNSSGMPSPACIQSAIPVGDTYVQNYSTTLSWGSPLVCSDVNPRQDQIVCHSNRDSVLELLAPGALINSTEYPGAPVCAEGTCSGNYAQLGGTSMAAPHVAGAIAVINQYLKSNSKTMTPEEIESALNATGKIIYDNKSNLTFSLINTYSALLSIDKEAPVVTLISPKSNSSSTNVTQTFSCNATDLSLKSMTFRIWNSTGLYYNKTESSTGYENSSSFRLSSMGYSSYKWNCFYTDSNGNTGYSAQNSTFILSRQLLFLSPSNNTYTNKNETFECNSSYSNETLSKINFRIYNSTSLLYKTTENITGHSNYSKFYYNFTSQGEYKWGCSFNTSNNTSVKSGNYSVYYDTTPPKVTALSPSNLSSITGTQQVPFLYNISDNVKIGNCSLILNGKAMDSNLTLSSGESSFRYTLSPGKYNWSIKCYDKAGNLNYTSLRFITVNNPPSSSGGGGGGSVSPVQSPSQGSPIIAKNITEGYTLKIPQYNYQSFRLSNNQSHIIFVDKVNTSSVEITVESNPIKFTLNVGESKYLNLSSPYYYNLYVKLNSIEGNSANLTIKEVTASNRIFHTFDQGLSNGTNTTEKSPQNFQLRFPQLTKNEEFAAAVIIILIIIFIASFYGKNRKEKSSKKTKKNKSED